MRRKTYIAKSVDEAIAQARQELGAEATLLNTRRVEGGYEIVFGVPEPPEVGRTPWSARDALVPPELSRPGGRLRTRGSAPPPLLAQGLERLHLSDGRDSHPAAAARQAIPVRVGRTSTSV